MIRQGLLVWIFLHATLPILLGQDYLFTSHSLPEEWHSARPGVICQDRDGLIWLGTREGVFRYDGTDFVHFPLNKEGNKAENVTALFSASADRLWIGYDDGRMGMLEGSGMGFIEEVEFVEGGLTASVTGFAEDGEGRLWISTYGQGVFVIHQGQMIHFENGDGFPDNDVYCITADETGAIWLGTDNGLVHCAYDGSTKLTERFSESDGLPDLIVKAVKHDRRGNLWIGTHDGGICRFSPSTRDWFVPEASWEWGEITAIEEVGGQVWVGTAHEGVIRYETATHELKSVAYPGVERHQKIYDLMLDREGQIWLLHSGPDMLAANTQLRYSQLTEVGIHIQSVLCSRNQTYWVGTDHGLFAYDVHTNAFSRQLPTEDLHVVSLYEDDFGHLWIGTFGEGVLCLDPESGRRRWLKESDGLYNESVLSIDGHNQTVWLATLGGITQFDLSADFLTKGPEATKTFRGMVGLGSGYVYKVFADSRGDIWFGTDGDGLSRLKNDTVENWSFAAIQGRDGQRDTTPIKTVYAITEDRAGQIWFSTADDEVFTFDGQAFTKAAIKNINGIAGLQGVDETHLAITHKGGLSIVNPATGQMVHTGSGVIADEFAPNLNTTSDCGDGCVLVAGQKQLEWFCPLPDIQMEPKIHIYAVMDVSQPIDQGLEKQLSHRQNDLVFRYTGLWYAHPESILYRYRLKGHQNDWIETKDNQAVFANLPPGAYTFEVAATVDHFSGNEQLASLEVFIRRPIWQQWWFITIALILATLSIYRGVKIREKRIVRLNRLEKEMAESRFETLKSQINPHFLFNSFNTLIAIIEENPALAVTFTENLSDFYRKILVHRQKSLIRLEEELELVRTFSYLLGQRFDSNFSLEISGDSTGFSVAPLTLQMLVENAVKHNIISRSKPLHMQITIDRRAQTVEVSNPLQKKMRSPDSTGFGLQNIVSRYALLHTAPVTIIETDTEFRVTIPLINTPDHESADY